jgi:transcriptional regulator with PAS, ATPase and Fis domain
VLEAFKSYSWAGNIRQLANVIERAVILEESDIVRNENVVLEGSPIGAEQEVRQPINRPGGSIKDQEKGAILRALEESLWVQKDAAKLLDISPRSLNYKIRKLGITHPRWRKNR